MTSGNNGSFQMASEKEGRPFIESSELPQFCLKAMRRPQLGSQHYYFKDISTFARD